MNYFFIIVLSVLLSNTLKSQGPGYMGKKLSLNYGFYASPAFIGTGNFGINKIHEVSVEFAASKKVSIGFSTRFYNAISDNTKHDLQLSSFDIAYLRNTNNSSYNTSNIVNGTTQINGKNFMMYFKIFKGNYVAPWGKYTLLGIGLNTFKSTYSSIDTYMKLTFYNNNNNNNDVYFSNFGPEEQSFKRIDIMFGKGRSRIVANRVVIDYGFNLSVLSIAVPVLSFLVEDAIGLNETMSQNFIEKTSTARMRGVNRFNVFCKVGFLIF